LCSSAWLTITGLALREQELSLALGFLQATGEHVRSLPNRLICSARTNLTMSPDTGRSAPLKNAEAYPQSKAKPPMAVGRRVI